MAKIKYSVTVHAPSSDIDPKGREQFHFTAAMLDLQELEQFFAPRLRAIGDEARHYGTESIFPVEIIEFFKAAEKAGRYRVEMVYGGVEYKMYIRPDEFGQPIADFRDRLKESIAYVESFMENARPINVADNPPTYTPGPVVEGDALGVTGPDPTVTRLDDMPPIGSSHGSGPIALDESSHEPDDLKDFL